MTLFKLKLDKKQHKEIKKNIENFEKRVSLSRFKLYEYM